MAISAHVGVREQDLFLDSSIRDWVLIPITIVMVLVGVLRSNVLQLLQSTPKRGQLSKIREQRVMVRSQALQANLFYIPPQVFLARRQALIDAFTSGEYIASEEKQDSDAAPKNPMENMDGMMGMLKNNMVMMVPQTVIMGWINFFFNGFVITKLPFPLTLRFKPMMQRGIDTPDMDVAWVSSLSWYFLNLFGLTAVYRLVLGDDAAMAEGARDMASMGAMTAGAGGMPAMPGAPGPDQAKLQAGEKDNLSISAGPTLAALGAMARAPSLGEPRPRAWAGDGIEDRVLALYADEF